MPVCGAVAAPSLPQHTPTHDAASALIALGLLSSTDAPAVPLELLTRGGTIERDAVQQERTKLVWPGRVSAAFWGAQPPPACLVHWVCAGWPGAGGRIVGMQLWGRWHQADIEAQLLAPTRDPPALDSSAATVGRGARTTALKFDAHAWLRACGLACGVSPHGCAPATKRSKRNPLLQPCASWLLDTSWLRHQLEELWSREHSTPTMPTSADLEAFAKSRATPLLDVPQLDATLAALVAVAARARATHPRALVAFRSPLMVADRREYQLHVRVLFSAAMLTARRPVLPLAQCNEDGEWGELSRCVYVMHAASPATGKPFCVMRPPSTCLDRIALPNELSTIPESETAIVQLPRLLLRDNGRIDAEAFGAAMASAQVVGKRLLLLDLNELHHPEELSNLLISPKGWLCPLDHKSCVFTCV
jgi:hypothetical protein